MTRFKNMALAIIFVGLSQSTPSLSEEGAWEPIFPVPEELPELPLIERVLFGVPIANPIDDDKERQAVTAEIARLEADESEASKNLKTLFHHYAALLQDASKNSPGRDETFSALRARALEVTKKYVTTKDRDERKIAQYYVLAHRFLDGQFSDLVGTTLKKRDLPPDEAFLLRTILMRGLADLDSARSRASLKKILNVAKKLSPEERIPAYLAIARSYAGLNSTGHHIDEPSRAYRGYVTKAATFAVMLDDASKRAVLNFTLAILRETEGQRRWDQVTLAASTFQHLAEWSAFEEGKALSLLTAGKVDEATAVYLALGKRATDPAVAAKVDRRVLDILQAKKGDSEEYDLALLEMDKKYRTRATKSDEAYTHFHQRHKVFVSDMINRCLESDAADKQPCPRAINLATKYQSVTADKAETAALDARIAAIHQHVGDHRSAVKILLKLARSSKGNQADAFWQSAAASQRILASWPETTPPWDRTPLTKPHPDLVTLGKIYERLLAREQNWESAAHLALIHYVNADRNAAFKLWEEWLLKSPGQDGMEIAAATILTTHHQNNQWAELVRVCHLFIAKDVEAELNKDPIDLKRYLADALFNGSAAALKGKDYKQAIAFLDEFTKDFPQDGRHAQALFTLSLAYHLAGDDQKSALIAKLFIDAYPQDKLAPTALTNGMAWSKNDKLSIFFHEKFIADYQDDSRVPAYRDSLIKLYMKNQLYGPAARTNKAKSLDERTPEDEKLDAAWQYLTIEDKYGDLKKALWGATRIIELVKGESPALADALGVLARYSNKYTKYDKLEYFENMIANFEFRDPHVRKNLAEVRLLIARRNAAKPLDDIQNIALKKPEATMAECYAHFTKLRNDFRKVCAVSSDEACENAKFELSTVSARSHEQISSIKLPSSLGEATIAPFNTKKNMLLEDISKTIIKDTLAGK